MATLLYRFLGPKYQGESYTRLVTADANNIERDVGIGETINLTDEQVARFNYLDLRLATDPIPASPVLVRPVTTADRNQPYGYAGLDENGDISGTVGGGGGGGGVGVIVAAMFGSLQLAFNEAKSRAYADKIRYEVEMGGYTWTIVEKLVIDTHFVRVRGGGCRIESQVTSGAAIQLWASGDQIEGQKTWSNSITVIEGFELCGPGSAPGTIGIEMSHPETGTIGPARLSLRNMVVRDFGVGIIYGNDTYAVSHDNVSVYRCTIDVQMPYGISNAGERLAYENCTFFESTHLVLNGSSGTDMHFDQCSFDYPVVQAVTPTGASGSYTNPLSRMLHAFSGRIFVANSHIEGNRDNDYWISSGDMTGRVTIRDTEIVLAANKNVYEIFYAGQGPTDNLDQAQHAGLVLDGIHFHMNSSWNYNLGTLVGGEGRVQARNITYEHGVINWMPPIARSLNIVRGNFEDVTSIADWNTASSTAGSAPTRDTVEKFEGTASMKFKPATAGHHSKAFQNIPVRPGQSVLSSYRQKTQGVAASGIPFQLTLKWFTPLNQQIGNTITYTDALDHDWQLQKPGALLVPEGASYLLWFYEAVAWPTSAMAWIDDLVINVI